jgi:hypothetical protein
VIINLNIILIKAAECFCKSFFAVIEWDKVITVSNDLETSLFHNWEIINPT